jgi:hypothetical protein
MGAIFTDTQLKLHVPPMVQSLLSYIFNSRLKHFWRLQGQKRMTRIMKFGVAGGRWTAEESLSATAAPWAAAAER